MNPLKKIKVAMVILSVAVGVFYILSGSARNIAQADDKNSPPAATQHAPQDFVGSETCQACHDEQFNSFSKTAHAGLAKAGWKTERQGCESCHGPGKAHVDAGGDKTKIRTFENESSKQKSEACLRCHAGREEHNNFRRGEHWRNDIGCTDCHSPHHTARLAEKTAGPMFGRKDIAASPQPVGPFKANANALPPEHMLIKSEPQLCISCHNETKSQFTQPFHHRVLEGAMKCSDCHNPHGGFELKQARLAVGADASCMKCHADKQGPFVFEHAPLKVEGCAACHSPHGSQNPKLLKRSTVAQLCIECHTDTQKLSATEGTPGTPSFHDLANPQYQNCTVCHVKIHGSNVNKVFFR